METPLFSVIVPIYNVEEYLPKCIESVLSQSFDMWELILVDDGSPDRCSELCDQYAAIDKRIKVVHKKNGGLVSARQAGVAIAHGEYIVCLDGDDWIENDYLSLFEKAIAIYSPDVICCGSTWSYPDGKDIKKGNLLPDGYYDRHKIQQEVFPYLIENKNGKYISPSLWAKAIRHKIYQQQQQQVNICVNFGEDVACVKPCLYHAQSIVFLESWSYHYRQNPNSMTSKKKVYEWDNPEIIGKHLEKQILMEEADFQEQVNRRVAHMLFNVVVSQFNRKEKFISVVSDIKTQIQKPYYKNVLEKCDFRGNWKWKFAYASMKYHLWFLIWLFCKIR